MAHIASSLRDKVVMKAPPPKEEKYWNRTIETMPRKELKELQWELLKNQIEYVYANSRFYRKRLDEAGVKPDDIKSIDDFRKKVPITSKDDIRADMKESGDIFGGTLGVPIEELAYFGPTTGTSGQPTQTAVTKEGMAFAIESMNRQYWAFGLRPGDLYLLFEGISHPGWQPMFFGPAMMGMPYVRFPIGSIFQQAEGERFTQLVQKLPVKGCYLPFSMLSSYSDHIEAKGLSPREVLGKTKCVMTSGDLITATIRKVMENYWGTKLHELQVSGDTFLGFYTCEVRNGLHIPEDLFSIEVVDIKTGEPVPMGERGYLVVTPTWQEGTCHLRWNSEDIVRMSDEPCECGRTHARIWFEGREAYVVNVRGQDILPHLVEDELLEVPEIEMRGFVSQLIKTAPETQDKLIVRTAYYEDKVKDLGELKNRVEERLKARFNVPVEVELMSPDEVKLVIHKVQRIEKRY